MIILGIESSCDETAVAIVEGPNIDGRVTILSNILSSSAALQSKYGGVVPEQAAREQLTYIIPTLKEALTKARIKPDQLDAIALTVGPGLIGSLLVGVETAKALCLVWDKPLISVNHLLGHFYANWIVSTDVPSFPCLGLLVSGGHTDLVLFTGHGKYQYIGGTRDDAAGECFDKSARALGLPYPGGPQLAKLADTGNPDKFKLPRPMINSQNADFSFSGLKTAVINLIADTKLTDASVADLCACVQDAIVDVLVKKTIQAAHKYQVEQILVAGGVAANIRLGKKLKSAFHGTVIIPPAQFCTDNAAMIAGCAIYNFRPQDPLQVEANPNLSLTNTTTNMYS